MEIPTIAGILRKSPEMSRSSEAPFNRDQSFGTVNVQDKGSVRFSDGDIEVPKMNNKLLTTSNDKVRFTYDNDMESTVHEDDEDYSASVNAIIQRRVSSKRKKRRSSSPFSPEDFSAQSTPRRRSSGFTVTSLDTSPSTEDTGKEEQIYENIRLHKEVITNVKQQPWPIRRKLKLLQQAKAYVKRHEGELQVRLKQSRSTKDILTRFNILIIKKWQHTKREIINFMNLLIPWELRIKEIESHFGTVVASYFTFLRWLFWVNLVISIILTAFVIVPEVLMNKNRKDEFRNVLPNERRITLDMLLNFEGILKYSPIFYGYYSNKEEKNEYRIPTAYFMIGIGVYIYSFIAILRKMAVNFRLSKLSEKEDECIFTWKLFTGWDYMIGNAETGHNRTSSIVLGFKEALLEEAEKKKEKRSWKVISIRVFVNINVIWMLVFSAQTVVYVVDKSSGRQNAINEHDSAIQKWWKQNETTVVMTVIGSIFPFIFEIFGWIEKYHPRKTLRIQLARIMALNLLNLYTLTFALFNQIGDMNKELRAIRGNLSNSTYQNGIATVVPQSIASLLSIEDGSPHFSFDKIFNLKKLPDGYNESLQFHSKCNDIDCAKNFNYTTPNVLEFVRNRGHFNDPATGIYWKPIPALQFERNRTAKRSTSEEMTTSSNWYSDTTTETSYENLSYVEYTEGFNISTLEFMSSSVDNYTSGSTDDYTTTETNYFEEISTTPEYNSSSSTVSWYSSSTQLYNISKFWVPRLFGSTTSVPRTTTIGSTIQFERKSDNPVNTTLKPLLTTQMNENYTTTMTNRANLNSTANLSFINVTTKTITGAGTTVTPFTCRPEIVPTQIPVDSIDDKQEDYSNKITTLNGTERQRLRRLCWETMFGQELVKLTIMDLAENIMSTFLGDFIRALLVRYLNKVWCWDLEKKFPKYADFKIAENILHLVNNQGLVWMGMFFSPGLPLINVVKLMIMMYLRSWAVLTCNVPHEVVFRASRSNNFYLALLLTMLFLCVLPVCYAIVWLEPSWHCGPFSREKKIYRIFVRSVKGSIHPSLHVFLDYIASPGTVIPLIIVLLLVIYYLASLTSALREANVDLKVQLRRERTEERKKMFQMASRRKRGGSDVDSTFAKWKKILQEVPSTKLSDEVAFPDGVDEYKKVEDTDIDNGLLKHDEEKQKIKKIFRSKNKTESASERKWGTLLRIAPKSQKEHVDIDSTSTTSSLKDDSSMKSENIPEIKISGVQTLENLMKAAERMKQPATSTIEEQSEIQEDIQLQLPKIHSSLETQRRRSNLKQIGKSAKLDSENDEVEDDVFLESVVVEVPEMPKITESISNRIKRRLKKVLSMGSNEESQQISESRPSRSSITQASLSEERYNSRISIDKPSTSNIAESTRATSLSEKDRRILEYRRSKLVKSESMNMERDKKWKNYMQRRKSSLDEIHLHLPDV